MPRKAKTPKSENDSLVITDVNVQKLVTRGKKNGYLNFR
jgi:hypothetical protein